MDYYVTSAISAAIQALWSGTLGEGAKRATSDAYDTLKRQIQIRNGEDSEAARLVSEVGMLPAGSATMLEYALKRLDRLELDKDETIRSSVEALKTAIGNAAMQGTGPQTVHQVVKDNAQSYGPGIANGPVTFKTVNRS